MKNETRKEIWELAEKLFVNLQNRTISHPMTTASLISYSFKLSEEFITTRNTDLEINITTEE